MHRRRGHCIMPIGERCRWKGSYAGALSTLGSLLLAANIALADPGVTGPKTNLHYAPNDNVDSAGNYVPGKFGFNLADVASVSKLNALGPGVKGLVWVGQCNGVDETFLRTVRPFIGNPKVFGIYLMDDPDPRGITDGNLRARCRAENLKAASDWIHTHMPGVKTFVLLMNISSSKNPSFENTYNPSNTGIDLFGISPYPCRTDLDGCHYEMIDQYVHAAEASGIPADRIVPVYQAFGGGQWVDDGNGKYTMPTIDEECQILDRWQRLIETPVFDFAYSWGVQREDIALEVESASDLRRFFSVRNEGKSAPCRPNVPK